MDKAAWEILIECVKIIGAVAATGFVTLLALAWRTKADTSTVTKQFFDLDLRLIDMKRDWDAKLVETRIMAQEFVRTSFVAFLASDADNDTLRMEPIRVKLELFQESSDKNQDNMQRQLNDINRKLDSIPTRLKP